MRIALIMNLAPMKVGSLEDWLVAMAAEAERRGHSLDLFVLDPIHPLVRERLLAFKAGLFTVSELTAHPARSSRRLARNYDVIQLHLWGPRELPALIALGARPAKVLYVDHFSGSVAGLEAQRGQLRQLVDRMGAVPFAGFAGVSDYVSDRLKRRVGVSRVRTIYNGIDVERFWRHPKVSEGDTLRVLAVSQLIPEKGLDVLLRAVAIARLPRLRVVIAGDGPEADSLVHLADELGISAQVTFVGVRHDVETLLDDCDVFVHPCRWQEAFGLAVAEAMAAGRPVIATRSGALPELVKDSETGLLVEPGDPDALSNALIRLASDRNLRQEMATNGQAKVHLFSLATSVQKHLDWCESAVPAATPRSTAPVSR